MLSPVAISLQRKASQYFVYRNGIQEEIKKHMIGLPVKAGERIVCHVSGGGGVGDAFERDVELVRQDVRNGLVSVEAARQEYGVVIDPGSYEVDQEATKACRGGRSR